MAYVLSQLYDLSTTTNAMIFAAEFVLLMFFTHWIATRHRARQRPDHPELYLVIDNSRPSDATPPSSTKKRAQSD
jgi:hypothetical protein